MLLKEKIEICKSYYEIMVAHRNEIIPYLTSKFGQGVILNHFDPTHTVLPLSTAQA